MSSEQMLTTLDIEDLSAKQLRKILNGMARAQLPYSKKSKEEKDKQAKDEEDENDSLVNLHREKKGDSKPPKVLASDLPKDDDKDEDEEEDTKGKKA